MGPKRLQKSNLQHRYTGHSAAGVQNASTAVAYFVQILMVMPWMGDREQQHRNSYAGQYYLCCFGHPPAKYRRWSGKLAQNNQSSTQVV